MGLPRGIIAKNYNLLSLGSIFTMTPCPRRLRHLMRFAGLLLTLTCDAERFLFLCLRPSPALAAENLFLRKQLPLYQERHTTPRRATNAIRLASVWLGRWFDWRQVLALVQPETFLRWHRQGFQLLWRWQSRPGRPRIPGELRKRSSARWHRTTLRGARSASLTNCCSSWVCGCRRALLWLRLCTASALRCWGCGVSMDWGWLEPAHPCLLCAL